ncbi:MAG: IS21-like element helper ATPase IstB [Candidatus Obscuribacterales bacterium]|nr:IS21-like element helper ATPase IstB [Candidatus Obscuribacterales bacterium]
MLIHPTIDNLKSLKLFAMASALENQQTTKSSLELSFEERLGILVDAQLAANDSKSLKTRLSKAKLRMSACLEDLDHKAGRGLDKTLLASLATSVWIGRRRNVIIEGKTGAGKTYLACALAHQGCRDGYSVLYARAPALFEDLSIARAVGTFKTSLAALAKIRLLVLDDFAMAPMTDEQRKNLLEVVEARYEKGSTILASQMPQELWHEIIGDPTFADAILDRLVHNAHKIKLAGKSMRAQKIESDG